MNTKYISTTIALLAIAIVVTAQTCANNVCSSSTTKYCQQANDCGNVPYSNCSKPNSCFFNPGVVLGTADSGVLYYSEICYYGANDETISVTLNQDYSAGNVPTVITTTFNLTAPLLLGRQNNEILNAVGNGVPFIYGYSTSDGSVTKYPLPQGYNTVVSLTSDAAYYYAVLFLPNTGYQIVRLANPLSTTSNPGTVVYTLGQEGNPPSVARGENNDLFFTVGDNVYKGDATCIQCSLPYPIHQISGINDLVYAQGNLYFGTSSGLIKYTPGANQLTLVSGTGTNAVQSLTANSVRLFYTTDNGVFSIDFLGGNQYTVSQANPGICVCRPGFTGSDCQSCSGQVVWNNGEPTCVNSASTNNEEKVSTSSSSEQESCYGEVITTARSNGNWVSGNTFYQIYDISVKNLGRCPITRALYDLVYISGASGGSPAGVSQAWNVQVVNGQAAPNPIQLNGGVAPGATLTGVGIVVYNSTSSYEDFHGPNVFCDAECTNQSS